MKCNRQTAKKIACKIYYEFFGYIEELLYTLSVLICLFSLFIFDTWTGRVLCIVLSIGATYLLTKVLPKDE